LTCSKEVPASALRAPQKKYLKNIVDCDLIFSPKNK
jgi:hypothetical protein